MGKRIDDENMFILDDSEEEKELLEAYEKGELVPVENQEEMRRKRSKFKPFSQERFKKIRPLLKYRGI